MCGSWMLFISAGMTTRDDIIDAIYAEAAGSGEWSQVLTMIEDMTRSRGAFFTGHDIAGWRPTFRLSSQSLEHSHEGYGSQVYRLNDRLKQLLQNPSGAFILGNELTSDKAFENSTFYNEFMRDFGLFYTGGSILESDGISAITFGVIRAKDEGDFADEHISDLKNLSRHMHRALKVRQTIESRDAGFALVKSVSDRAPYSIFVLDEHLEVIEGNSEAREMLEDSDGVSLNQGRLWLSDAMARQRLEAIAKLGRHVHTAEDSNLPASFAVNRPSGAPPLWVSWTPAVDTSSPMTAILKGVARPAVILFITDARREWRISHEALVRHFELTDREADLVSGLVRGETLEQICDLLMITQNTAKTHLKRAFQKTATARQADLVRYVISAHLLRMPED